MKRLTLLALVGLLSPLVIASGNEPIAMPASSVKDMPGASLKTVRLVSEVEHKRRLSLIPDSADKHLQKLRGDPRLVWYDRKVLPPLYQHWRVAINATGPHIGIESIFRNESGNPTEPFGNANREFPWAATGGLREGDPVMHFVIAEKPAKMKWLTIRRDTREQDETYLDWKYADGTIFGELILVKDSEGQEYTSELRLRKKSSGEWTATAYRPFPTADDLVRNLDVLPEDDRFTIQKALRNPPVARSRLLNRHPRAIFSARSTDEYLPEISEKGVRRLLRVPFQNALGSSWRADYKDAEWPTTHAPTTQAAFHIVPKGYDAGGIEVSSKSCLRCHDTAGAHVEDIEPFRDWYGQVRGSDTIFSMHPFVLGGTSRQAIFNRDLLNVLFTME